MARLDEYIFGYRRGKVAPEDTPKLACALLRLGICSSVCNDGSFTVRERDKARFISYARAKMRFELSEPLGLYGFIWRSRRRYGAFLGIIVMTVLFIFTTGLVWDVRITGNERISDYAIENSLSDLGLEVGSYWRRTDKNAIESKLLASDPDIAWISVNRRGTVAYVEIIESENVGFSAEDAPLYSNVVAERDGVIEEITVRSGCAVVKIGDVVRAGDVLISGIVENEAGVSFCRAEGTVKARSVTDVTVEAAREVTEKVSRTRRLTEARLVLFNFSINIFKNYGNHENSCDIIKETREFSLFDKCKLPVRIERTYACEYTEATRSRSTDEMTAAAKRELDGRIYAMFRDADVIKLRTGGELVDDVYRLTSRVVYSTEIGKESEIEIN